MKRHVGAFGKIPALGDFFRIGLPPAFIEPWDQWLQSGHLAARNGLGDRWETCYNSAPIWHFTLSEGLAGPLPVQGLVMCSVDRVGRQFPLTLAVQLEDNAAPAEAHFAAKEHFEMLETIALDMLEDDATRDQLSSHLEAFEWVDAETPHCKQSPKFLLSHGSSSRNLRDTLAASFLTSQYQHLCIWSAEVNETAFLCCHEGLPPPEWMKDFLDTSRIVADGDTTE